MACLNFILNEYGWFLSLVFIGPPGTHLLVELSVLVSENNQRIIQTALFCCELRLNLGCGLVG